jgi:hypothetical protein
MCKSCAKKLAKVAGPRRKTNPMAKSRSSITSKATLTNAAGVLGGLIAAKFVNKLEFVAANDILKILVPAAGAVATGMLVKGQTGTAIAVGMLCEAGIEGVKKFAPDVAGKVGLAGPTPFKSYLTPGVAGTYETAPNVVI